MINTIFKQSNGYYVIQTTEKLICQTRQVERAYCGEFVIMVMSSPEGVPELLTNLRKTYYGLKCVLIGIIQIWAY